MADLYWVGGSTPWNGTAGTKWATTDGGAGGAAEPTSADNVFFTALSGAVAVPLQTTSHPCANLSFAGFTGTISGVTAIQPSGSLTMGAGMTNNWTGALQFQGTTAGNTITSNGITFASNVTFNQAGGEYTLADAFTTSGAFTVTSGKFFDGGFNLSASMILSSNTNTRTVQGSTASTWTCTGGGGVSAINFSVTTGLTFTAPGVIKLTDATTGNKGFNGGSLTYNTVWFSGAVTGTFTLLGSNTIAELKIDQAPKIVRGGNGTTQRIAKMTGFNGTPTTQNTLKSNVDGTPFTFRYTGTDRFIGDYLIVKDSIGTPANKWYYGKGAVNAGNNSGWQWNSVFNGGGKQRKQAQLEEDQEIQELLDILAPQLQGYYQERGTP